MTVAIKCNRLKEVKELLPMVDIHGEYPRHGDPEEYNNIILYSLYRKSYPKYGKSNKCFDYLIDFVDVDYNNEGGGKTIFKQLLMSRLMTEESDIRKIVSMSKNIDQKDVFSGITILDNLTYDACDMDDLKEYELYVNAIRILLEYGANPFTININGESPIEHAIYRGDIKLVQIFLDHNLSEKYTIDIEIFIREVICAGCYMEGYDMIEMLIPYVSDINELHEGHSVL